MFTPRTNLIPASDTDRLFLASMTIRMNFEAVVEPPTDHAEAMEFTRQLIADAVARNCRTDKNGNADVADATALYRTLAHAVGL